MAVDYEEVDYDQAWYDSYDEWQENAVAAASTRQQEMADFMNSIPGMSDVSEGDIMDGGFTDEVNAFDQDDWTDVPRDKAEWAAKWAARTRDDMTLEDAREALDLT